MQQDSPSVPNPREWSLIEKLLLESTKEQKRARRWGIFFKVLVFIYIFAALLLFQVNATRTGGVNVKDDHVAVVPVEGVIAADEKANANAIVGALRKAFEAEHSKAVLLAINSPGGSPVQAGYVNDEIYRLKALHPEKKVYAVISDLGASGAYYIAAAADEIYADKASLVGSIGVTASGFGFVGLMDKLGVERRRYTSGEHKAFLDPFSPQQPEEVTFWRTVLEDTHKQFIAQVEKGRGDRLVASENLYSGLIWNGEQAKEMGLVDGLGSAGYVAREVIGVDKMVSYGAKPNPLAAILERFGVSMGAGFAKYLTTQQSLTLQ
ncbi:S49 family peptidase [Halioxenophilus sp. WMMB6]|uniref:S49 family peptidase n=1 Tax=Halioxenophilus sp. WMMB6 TaxID=3073815 RepID=UPI00295E3FA7|nr:S49 family peptidase [Halioxenophilus sp. WMMB6]